MKRIVLTVLGLAGVTAAALAQAPDESIERALAAAPPQAQAETTVVKWALSFM